MAYDKTKLTNVGQLEEAMERTKTQFTDQKDFDELEQKVDELTLVGGEPNKIDEIKVNNEPLTIDENKSVNITVPTATSDLENDSNYQTGDEVETTVMAAIANIDKISMKVVDEVPDPAEAEADVFYLVMNAETEHYDIYVLIGGAMVWLDDTTVDLSDYVTDEALEQALEEALADYYTKAEIDEAYEDVLRTSDIISDEDFEEMLDSIFGTKS